MPVHPADRPAPQQPAQSGPQTGAAGPQTATSASETRTGHPGMAVHPWGRPAPQQSCLVSLHYDERLKQAFFVDPKGKKIYVKYHRNRDGTVYFELNGKKYPAEW